MTEYVNKDYYNSIKGNCSYIDLNGQNIHSVMERLKAEGIMFSAAYGGYRNTVTVSKADSQKAFAIAAEYKQAPVQNTQRKQRIIGNIEYSKIKDRNFINTDPDTALQVANLLSGDASIRFSGRILENSATITVSGRKNAEMVNRMIDNIRNADIINELYKAGYERLADTNGFVNIRNNASAEVVGFRSMDMVREMFGDASNEFFHPTAYRVDSIPEAAEPFYISEVDRVTADERNVYVDENADVPLFDSRENAEQYAEEKGIDLTGFEEIIPDVPVEHIDDTEDLSPSEQLKKRVNAELEAYIAEIKSRPFDEIIEAAYRVTVCKQIGEYITNEEPGLTEAQLSALLSMDNVLDEIYLEWVKNDSVESYDDVLMVMQDRADRILLSQQRENVPVEHFESEVPKDEVAEALSLAENNLTFSVVTINNELVFAVGEYIEKDDIHGLEEYQDYIAKNQPDEVRAYVEYCMIGNSELESEMAYSSDIDFINANLKAVMNHPQTTNLEINNYVIVTPDEMLESRQADKLLAEAKEYITDFLEKEYGTEPSEDTYKDLENVPLGYTSLGDDADHDFSVTANLVDFSISYTLDGVEITTEKYDSLEEMTEVALTCLDFDDMVTVGNEALEEIENKKFRLVIPEIDVDIDMRDIDSIAVQTPDDVLMFYYSSNNKTIERAWQSDDNSDTAVDIDDVAIDIRNAVGNGFAVEVYETAEDRKIAEDNSVEIPENLTAIDDDTAVIMWEQGITVYHSGTEIPPMEENGENEHSIFENLSDDFYADKEDVKAFRIADDIASEIWDMNRVFFNVPNEVGQPYYLSIESGGYDEWEDYNKGLNEYQNTLKALYTGNFTAVEDYLENVRSSEDVSEEMQEQAASLLDAVKSFRNLSGIEDRAKKENEPTYKIYQLKKGEEYHNLRFTRWDDMPRFNLSFDRKNYDEVYGGNIADVTKFPFKEGILEDIFKKFNSDRPEDFKGRSLSVSDVVVLEDKEGSSAYFVDTVGMADVTDLFFELKKETIDLSKLTEVEITEEYDRRGDEPDNSTHVKNTILFTDLDKFEISRYKDFTYDNGVMPDSDEGYTTVTSQDMLDEINGYMDKSRKKSGISISVTDNVGNTKRLNGLLFEFTFGDRNVPVEHLEENEKMPLYGKSIEEASELGERDKYFANMKENKRCEDAIVTAIADNYRNSRLDTDGVLSDVLKEFVFERIELVVAARLSNLSFDGRIDKSNVEWANDVLSGLSESERKKLCADTHLNSHPGLINLFANKIIDEERVLSQKEQATEKEAEPYEPKLGDKFRDNSGEVWELTSLTGVMPWYNDQCAITSISGNVSITKNENYSNLLDTAKYHRVADAPEAVKTADYSPKIGDLVELDGQVYSVADIDSGVISLADTETLLGETMRMTLSEFLSSGFEVVEANGEETVSADVPVEHLEKSPEKENVPVEHHSTNANNFVITDENLGVKTPKARFAANAAAIRTLNAIEAEHRTATPVEQAILSGYTGWGAIPNAFDPDNKDWSNEYAELKTLLTDEEFIDARRSTLNAHFTSPIIINAIYEGLANLGFEQGKILEPAMGIGNFFGMLPEAMRGSELHGVELDDITGRIARQHYPDADIQIKGFEKTKFENDSFDAVVGNVPFGDYKLSDKDYDKHKFYIHDYFVAKSIDKVRPGGVVAVVTSKGTMDKENPEMRMYVAQRAELLGAIRLPNNAFKANAGTEVTSDILFFQKRERAIEINPDEIEWLNKTETAEGFRVNGYFANHPEMVLGTITEANQKYGPTENTQVIPIEGADLKQQLAEAVQNIQGTYTPRAEKDTKKKETEDIIPAPANSRVYSYYAVNGSMYFREDGDTMAKANLKGEALKRALAMVELRDTVRELLDMQLDNADRAYDTDISECRAKLNEKYDAFVEQNGHFDDKKNIRAFKGDDGYNFLIALESKNKDTGEYEKVDIFYHDTVKPNNVVTHVETAEEALILSVAEKARVDFEYMTELCGMSKETLISELEGQIYRLPQEEEKYVTADEYLTGNIRTKLRQLEFAPEGMDVSKHREALEAAMPKRVEAKDISVKLGAHWVAPEYVTQFVNQKFYPSWRSRVEAQYSRASGKWKIEGASQSDKGSYTAIHDYGTKRKNAYAILEGILNHEDMTIKDPKLDEHGEPIRDSRDNIVKVTNHEETKAVQLMVKKIESEWEDWIFKDPDRREKLVEKYNEVFNSIRHREYDGSHLNFVGMNSDITLKEHQKNAVARALYGGNTLLAHCVGAGKTFEMITIAMEGKRLGLHNKSLFAVPNSLTEQMGRDFKKLYPAANVLVATKKDFEPKNRKMLFAKIATGEWDAVIVGHSQFDRMGLSAERMNRYLKAEIESLRSELEEAKSTDGAKSFSVKEIERTITRYEKRLTDEQNKVAKDDYIDFEQMGFDKIFVDECHMYKNLGTATKMSNVAGIGTTGSGKAAELLMKTKYLDELTGGRGLVFASGTPVSNSMVEFYVMQRYLRPDLLKKAGLQTFDDWASTFGEVVSQLEIKPAGNGFQMKNRFSKFVNIPELMQMYKEFADIQTPDMIKLPVPKLKTGEPIVVTAKPDDRQKAYMKELAARSEAIHNGNIDPSVDNMLKITHEARLLGLDSRCIFKEAEPTPDSKVMKLLDNLEQNYRETMEQKGVQIVFCDIAINEDSEHFSVYEAIKADLVKRGIPREEICFAGDAQTDKARAEMFEQLRKGEKRFIIASTSKLETGANIQDKICAIHHLDIPWKPADLTQQDGRGIRQGNSFDEVGIYHYLTEETFDAYMMGIITNKAKFINQIMTSKDPVRVSEDVDEMVLTYSQMQAIASGNPMIKEKIQLDNDVANLKKLEAEHKKMVFSMQELAERKLPQTIDNYADLLQKASGDLKAFQEQHPDNAEFKMEIDGKTFDERAKVGEEIEKAIIKCSTTGETVKLGKYFGFDVSIEKNPANGNFFNSGTPCVAVLQGNLKYTSEVSLGNNVGNVRRIENLAGIQINQKIQQLSANLDKAKSDLEEAKANVTKPFGRAEELAEKLKRLEYVNAQLSTDKNDDEPMPVSDIPTENEPVQAASVVVAMPVSAYTADRVNPKPQTPSVPQNNAPKPVYNKMKR